MNEYNDIGSVYKHSTFKWMNGQGFLPFFWVLFSEEGLNGRVELAVHLGVGESLGTVSRTAGAAEAALAEAADTHVRAVPHDAVVAEAVGRVMTGSTGLVPEKYFHCLNIFISLKIFHRYVVFRKIFPLFKYFYFSENI